MLGRPTHKGMKMTEDQMFELARGAIERHLGDVCEGEDSPDSIYDEAYTLAHDALVSAGIDTRTACTIAQQAAQAVAQP